MKRALLLLLISRAALAFPTGSQFDLDPMKADGAGGIAFDGAPRWQGHTCAVCHTDAPGTIGSALESDHVELFTTGYTPGMQYHLRVVLLNEHAGVKYQKAGDNCGFNVMPYTPCDQNGFALEIADLSGKPQGKFVAVTNNMCATTTPPTDVDVRVLNDGTAVTHNGAHHGQVAWDLCWTAPPAGTGPLTAYLAIVDGDGGSGPPHNGSMSWPADTINDDVTSGAVPLGESGGAPPPSQAGGCNAGGGEVGIFVAFALLVLIAIRRKPLALVLALATAASCSHVRPRERETLARRNMKFAPDPTEDELDLHMQEAREGSSGGYGSSGGGCGCN